MINLIENELEKLIPVHSPYYASLFEGARYSLLSPGKRIRPLLTLHAVKMQDEKSVQCALHPACALEIVHCYSLIHDDLPCMDNDDFRRGLPTLHTVYNEGHAVLVGDYLLTYAFEILSKAPSLRAEQKIALIQILSTAAGSEGMVGGQIMDIEKHPEIQEMHQRKTAALFKAAMAFSGIITNASSSVYNQLLAFGQCFGELFQMVDDVLDKDHPQGEEKAKEAVSLLQARTLKTLYTLPGDPTAFQELILMVSRLCEKSPEDKILVQDGKTDLRHFVQH